MNDRYTSRTKLVLVFGGGSSAKAVVTDLVVTASKRSRQRYRVSGPVKFDPKLSRHVGRVILPLVDEVCERLGLPLRRFDVSIGNLGAASAMGRGATVSEYSADVALFLAMLAAACRIELPAGVIATGHIASRGGEIRYVRYLREKLEAAREFAEVTSFVCPAFEDDRAFARLMPEESAAAKGNLRMERDEVRVVPVEHVATLVETVLPCESIVTGALRGGFFGESVDLDGGETASRRIAAILVGEIEKRFDACLEEYLLEGAIGEARELLARRVDYQIERQAYPDGLGARLESIVAGMPPSVRRSLALSPVISPDCVVELGKHAGAEDAGDVRALFRLAAGKSPAPVELDPEDRSRTEKAEVAELAGVLDAISRKNLAIRIGSVIDTARAVYRLDSSTAESKEEFDSSIIAYFTHLLRHADDLTGTVEVDDVTPGAHELVEKAYHREGGYTGALVEALSGTGSGMRGVLDRMTDQFKAERQENFVLYMLKTAFDPTDFEAAVRFMRAFLDRYGRELPESIRSQPPERWARKHEEIIRAYVQSRDGLARLMQTL